MDMLTPEERAKEEERTRIQLEVRRQAAVDGEKRQWKIAGLGCLVIILFLVLFGLSHNF